MLDHLIAQLLPLQGYILLVLTVGFALLVIGLLLSFRFHFVSRRIYLLGLFYGLCRRDIRCLAACTLWFLYVLWCIFSGTELQAVHYAMLLALSVWAGIAPISRRGVRAMASMLGNGALLGLGILALNLLSAYNREIRYEQTIAVVYWLLASFLILYSLQAYLSQLGQISSMKGTSGC